MELIYVLVFFGIFIPVLYLIGEYSHTTKKVKIICKIILLSSIIVGIILSFYIGTIEWSSEETVFKTSRPEQYGILVDSDKEIFTVKEIAYSHNRPGLLKMKLPDYILILEDEK